MAKLIGFVEFRRDNVIRFRATDAEKKLISQMARDSGKTVSDYCRQQAMSRRYRSRLAATIINELVQINAELKQQRESIGNTEEYRLILAGVAEAIERIPADAQMEDF